MSRLITGVFYEGRDAEKAVEALKVSGVPQDDIFVEREIMPNYGQGGERFHRLERERRCAGMQAAVIMGMIAGCVGGAGVGILGNTMLDLMRSVSEMPANLPPILTSPILSAVSGTLIGFVTGVCVGWVVDYTLTRLGAGPSLPTHETLVTVSADETRLNEVFAALDRARVRHLHAAESPAIRAFQMGCTT